MIWTSFENRAKEITVRTIGLANLLDLYISEEDIAMKKFLLLKMMKENKIKMVDELILKIVDEKYSISEVEIRNVLKWSLK